MFFFKRDPRARIPTRNNKRDSGWDFYALEDTILRPGEVKVVPTGITIACPYGTPGWVWDRSGNGSKGLKTLGGVIDEPYVGEVGIILANVNLWNIISLLGGIEDYGPAGPEIRTAIRKSTITIPADKAIAQMVFHSVVDLQEIRELTEEQFKKEFSYRFDPSERGTKGFGSSDTVPEPYLRSGSFDQLKRINDSAKTEEQIGELKEQLRLLLKPPTLEESDTDRSC